jgi:hypothetical protein
MMDRFDRPDKYSQYWLNKACDVRAAAAAIWHCSEVDTEILKREYQIGWGFASNTFGLLCGYSLEALFKGILVEGETKIPLTHDLAKLADLSIVSLTADQSAILDVLTHETVWSGRYPKPNKRKEWKEYQEVHDKSMKTDGKVTDMFKVYSFDPNRAINWINYNAIWGHALSRYTELRQSNEPTLSD